MQRLWTYQQRSIELDLIFYQRDTTNEDGHFRLRGLDRGKYMALAFDDLQDDVQQPEFLNAIRGPRTKRSAKVLEKVLS